MRRCLALLWSDAVAAGKVMDPSWVRLDLLDRHHSVLTETGSVASLPADAELLHVFLPDTGRSPEEYSLWLEASRAAGHATIGLAYLHGPSDRTRNAACAPLGCGCLAAYHEDLFLGGNASGLVAASPEAAIAARLRAVLESLSSAEAAWERFLLPEGGGVTWKQVMLSGHSQGGGHAAWAASRIQLWRALLFSAPQDECISSVGSTQLWIGETWPTSDVRIVAHAKEELLSVIRNNWQIVGLEERRWALGVATSAGAIVVALPPQHNTSIASPTEPGLQGGSTQSELYKRSSSSSSRSCQHLPHCSTLLDEWTPRAADGDVAYAMLWRELLRKYSMPVALADGKLDNPGDIRTAALAALLAALFACCAAACAVGGGYRRWGPPTALRLPESDPDESGDERTPVQWTPPVSQIGAACDDGVVVETFNFA